jgi:hypothetical protein
MSVVLELTQDVDSTFFLKVHENFIPKGPPALWLSF